MSFALTHLGSWSSGYFSVSLLQMALSLVVFLSLPLWKKRKGGPGTEGEKAKPLTMKQILSIRGAKEVMLAFFCYCALEQTAALWASSYLALHKGIPAQQAAFFGSMFTSRPPRRGSMMITGIPFSFAASRPVLPAWECSSM